MNKVCFTFENISLTKESFDELCRVLRVRLEARRCQVGSRGLTLSFDIRPDMDCDSFHVYNNDGKIMLEANNLCTLYAAAGRLMTLGRFDGEGGVGRYGSHEFGHVSLCRSAESSAITGLCSAR